MPALRPAATALRAVAILALTATAVAACRSAGPGRGSGVLGAASPAPVPGLSAPAAGVPPSSSTPPTRTGTTLRPPTVRPPTTRPPTSRPPAGDLTISLVGGACGFYSDTGGGLWIAPTLRASWSGPGAFPGANLGFNMKTNYGKATAGGPVTSASPFTWAIGGEPASGNSWVGHTVQITVTIDPGDDVPESNESNNVAVVTFSVPSPLPIPTIASDSSGTIACS